MWGEHLVPTSCFGYTLQTGCKVVSLIQALFSFTLLLLVIRELNNISGALLISAAIIFILVVIIQCCFAGCLFSATKERNLANIQCWALVTVFLTGITACFILLWIYNTPHPTSTLMILSILSLFSNLGSLWIGLGFIKVLKEEEGEGGTVYNTDE